MGKPAELHLAFPMLIFNFHEGRRRRASAFAAFIARSGSVQIHGSRLRRVILRLSQRLRQKSDMDRRPKTTPYRDVAKRARTPAGLGTLGENAAAAIADFIVVDMFANYCTGRET